ncbi:hypothetical protein ACIGZJ_19665 [Kitasatospora sp. NPDC052868]|uniref:hypothetical protein n=1 Tax=Streptomycetaceae TaxID=2062 RepID=UPI0006AFCDC7|nr:hypothetical protein [Streptomyces sp. XY593]KOU93286.1 hypothetical protein ADK94_05525 [Streptomyces sp. XY593]
MFMDWIRFHKTDEDGRHYFQVYSVPQAWNAAAPKVPGTGRISETAARTFASTSPAGHQWRTPCYCTDCTIAAKSVGSTAP